MFSLAVRIISSLLVLCAAPIWAAGGNETNAELLLKNPGGSPDVAGTFLGESFVAFIAPSGFVALQYDPLDNGNVTTTYGRFTSWQCIDAQSVPAPFRNMSVSRNVYDAVTYDSNGVVTSSGTFCNIYVVDADRGRQWTTGTMLAGPGGAASAGGCPSVATVENAFVQGADSYINTQIVNTTILRQPSTAELVCGKNTTTPAVPAAAENVPPKGAPGLNATSLPEVGTTIDGFPVSASSDAEFPPELAGISIALSAYNTTTTISSGANVTLEIKVQTLEVTNGNGYGMIGLTSINNTPQRFYSLTSKGTSYEYLNTSSTYVQTKSSDVYIDENVTVARYDPMACTLIRLNTDMLSGYRSWFFDNSTACPTVKDVTNVRNTTNMVDVTKLTSFPADGAVQPASALALSSGTAENGTTAFQLSIKPYDVANNSSTVVYFNLNLTDADRVVGAEIRNQTGSKGVVLQLVPSAAGWPTAIVKGNKTLPSLLGPISGEYGIQGAFDLSEYGLEPTGAYFVNIRSESSNGTARGTLVLPGQQTNGSDVQPVTDAESSQETWNGNGDGKGDEGGSTPGAPGAPGSSATGTVFKLGLLIGGLLASNL